jgi:enamine deaminase RidA (YjgF/YER057c/UK114 family)
MIFVAGMIAWDAHGVFHTDDLAGQVRQALQNIVEVLTEGGAKPEHIVRMTWYVTDKKAYVAAYPEIGQAFRELIGSFSIAMTAVEVSALVEDRAKVEIEVPAVVPDRPTGKRYRRTTQTVPVPQRWYQSKQVRTKRRILGSRYQSASGYCCRTAAKA